MFTNANGHSKDDLVEVMQLQSVTNPLTDMKGELIKNVQQELQNIPSDIDTGSTRDLHMQGIPTLNLQNKSVSLLLNLIIFNKFLVQIYSKLKVY